MQVGDRSHERQPEPVAWRRAALVEAIKASKNLIAGRCRYTQTGIGDHGREQSWRRSKFEKNRCSRRRMLDRILNQICQHLHQKIPIAINRDAGLDIHGETVAIFLCDGGIGFGDEAEQGR